MATFLFVVTAVFEIVVAVLCSAIAIFSLYIYRQHCRYDHLPGPPRRSFFLGNLGEIMEYKAKGTSYLELTSKWRSEHGPIFVVYMLHNALVTVADPSVVKDVALNPQNRKPEIFAHAMGWMFGERVGGYGLFTETNHERWSKKRKLMDPAFKRKYLVGALGVFNHVADRAVDYLTQFGDGKTEVRMADVCGRVTLDTIGKATFGMKELNVITQPANELTKAIINLFTGAALVFHNSFIAKYDPRKTMRDLRCDVRKGVVLIRQLAKEAILARMEAMKRGDETPNDTLSFILRASQNLQDGKGFGLEEAIDEFLTLFVAGQDTTGNLLSSTLLTLGRYPEIMEKLKEEVDAVIGDKEEIGMDELNKLEYMSWVFKETLRLYSPAGAIHKIIANEIYACGYRVPANSFITLSHHLLTRDERFYDDPEKFDPERWRHSDERRMYTFFPFGIGPRICIGQNFALMEAKVVIGKFLQHFDIRLVPGQSFKMVTEITTRPEDGSRCYLKSRRECKG